MSRLRNLLLVVVVAELIVGGYGLAMRWRDPQPPLPDLSDLDSRTRADLLAAHAQTIHGGSPEWRTLAQAWLGYGYYAEAEQCFRVAVQYDPSDQESVYGLGFTLERVGRLEEAIEVLEQAAALSGDELSRTCQYQIGRCFLRLEQPDAAESAFRGIREQPAAAFQLAKILLHTGRAAEAVPLLNEQLARTPESHRFLRLRAEVADALGDADLAWHCRDAADRTPPGVVLEYGMDFIGMYRSRYGLDRGLTECTRLRAMRDAQALLGCLEGVLEIIRAEQLAQFDSVYVAAAEAALSTQDADRALAILDELRALEADDNVSVELRGDAHWLQGNRDEACDAWQRSLRLLPRARPHQKLADAWQDVDEDTAAAHRAAAHQLAARQAWYDGRIDEAYAEIRRAVALSPKSARNWYYLGETERLRGAKAPARAAYTKTLELDPDHHHAREALGRLE